MSSSRKAPGRWYHGVAGLGRGDRILPASETGAAVHHERAEHRGTAAISRTLMSHYDPTRTYVVSSLQTARLIAAGCAAPGSDSGGDVYEVRPDGPVTPDPDSPGGSACRSAVIVRVVERGVPAALPSQGEQPRLSGAELRARIAAAERAARADGTVQLWRLLMAPLLKFAAAHGDDDVVDLDQVAGLLAGVADRIEAARTAINPRSRT